MKNDDFGARMKSYETPTRMTLPPRTYTIIRVDGRAFHTHLGNAEKPFDPDVIYAMDRVAKMLCMEIDGACFSYTQSDEVSVLLTDLEPQSQPWFGGVVQKMASIAASIATASFNQGYKTYASFRPALFDARVYTIPSRIEVANYFLWRQKDAIRNAVSMAAQARFSHKVLQGKSSAQMQELLFAEKNINFKTAYSDRERRGGVVVRETYSVETSLPVRKVGEQHRGKVVMGERHPIVATRSRWAAEAAPDFTLDNGGFLALQIPQEPADALQPAEPECKASISGMCLEMVEGNSPCAIEDGECVSGGLPAREPKTIRDRMWPALVGLLDTPEKEECVRQVFEIIGDDDLAKAWIIGMNPFLDNLSPMTKISGGFFEDVLSAVRLYQSGGATS